MLRCGSLVFRVAVFCLVMVLVGASQAGAEDPLRVAVSIPPQKHFLNRIGGDLVEVEVLLPPGANPATYEPKPSQLVSISKARAYFPIGIPVESAWLERLQSVNPEMRIAPMYRGIERRSVPSTYEEALKPAMAKAESDQGHPDPHVWLAPPLARIMAQNARDELIRLDPEHAARYRANFIELAAKIDELDRELLDLFSGAESRSFLAYHPAWAYFARAYGLQQIPILLGANKLTAKGIDRLIGIAEERGLRTVFYQPQFSSRPAEEIARNLDGEARELDPLAQDWEANLRESAREIRKALDRQ